MDRHACKRNKALTCSFFAILAFIFSLVSCENFNKPVRGWFDYYTNTATVGDIEIDSVSGSYNGIQCVSSDDNRHIILKLRNPKNYTLKMTFVFDDENLIGQAKKLNYNGFSLKDGITYFSQSADKSIVDFEIPKSFLQDVENGSFILYDLSGNPTGNIQKNISGTVTINELDTNRDFNSFHINLIVNSAPPRMRDAMFQYDKSDSDRQYVVCFKIPNLNDTVHQKDTKTLVINGETYNVSFGSSVSITPPDGKLTTTKPSGLCNLNLQDSLFTHENGYIDFYYLTGIDPTDDRKTVNIALTDDYGFKTEVVVSNSTGKLIQPTLSVTDGNTYQVNETDGIYPLVISHTGESTKYDEDGNQVSGDRCSKPNIFYKLYKDGVTGVFKEGSGAAPLTVNLEKGKYYVETYAYADTFVDSDQATGFAAESGREVTIKSSLTYYVKNTGSDTAESGNGSKKKPYRTIQKCIEEFYLDYVAYSHDNDTVHTIEMLSDLKAQDGDIFVEESFVRFYNHGPVSADYKFVVNGHGYTIDASKKGRVLMTGAHHSRIEFNNVNFTGGLQETGGGIRHQGGTLTINGGSITGCHANENGGALYIWEYKPAHFNGVTITGNTAGQNGGGVYTEQGTLNLYGNCNITGNTVNDVPSNLYLLTDKTITIGSYFTGRVGVTTQKTPVAGEPVVITSGFSTNASGDPWDRFFPDNPSQGVIIYNNDEPKRTEAVLSVSSSLISTYTGEKIIVSCTENVTLGGMVTVSVVDGDNNDITSECTFENHIISYKTDTLIGSDYYTANGNTVTLQSGITEKDIYVLFVQFRYKGFDYDARIPFRVQ
ncbi:MAG: hypothetical protein K6E69_05475 [Treponema sp.]|uniref:hypothetical protein n=1 Tax=Treponema sp. TaxID=166 RepID=UPI00298E039B|nr:hypothetical protein [Treponema sp.]MCR5386552.1 hypothetical protein [Treponema sp.]